MDKWCEGVDDWQSLNSMQFVMWYCIHAPPIRCLWLVHHLSLACAWRHSATFSCSQSCINASPSHVVYDCSCIHPTICPYALCHWSTIFIMHVLCVLHVTCLWQSFSRNRMHRTCNSVVRAPSTVACHSRDSRFSLWSCTKRFPPMPNVFYCTIRFLHFGQVKFLSSFSVYRISPRYTRCHNLPKEPKRCSNTEHAWITTVCYDPVSKTNVTICWRIGSVRSHKRRQACPPKRKQ